MSRWWTIGGCLASFALGVWAGVRIAYREGE